MCRGAFTVEKISHQQLRHNCSQKTRPLARENLTQKALSQLTVITTPAPCPGSARTLLISLDLCGPLPSSRQQSSTMHTPAAPDPAPAIPSSSSSSSDPPTRSGSSSSSHPLPAAAASAHSAAEPSSSSAARQEYLEEKYGSSSSHVNLSREEVDAMVERALQDSPTVTYLLQSLKQVCAGMGCGADRGWQELWVAQRM